MTDYELSNLFQQIHAELVNRIRKAEQDAITRVMFHIGKMQDDVHMLDANVKTLTERITK